MKPPVQPRLELFTGANLHNSQPPKEELPLQATLSARAGPLSARCSAFSGGDNRLAPEKAPSVGSKVRAPNFCAIAIPGKGITLPRKARLLVLLCPESPQELLREILTGPVQQLAREGRSPRSRSGGAKPGGLNRPTS